MKLSNNLSYFFGFHLGDGHLPKTSNTFCIQLNKRDEDILHKLRVSVETEFPDLKHSISDRTYSTTYKENFESTTLRLNSPTLLEVALRAGIPRGRKSDIIKPLSCEFSECDFIRGYVDADGAIGLTSDGRPFVTMVISSEDFKEYICDFLHRKLGIIKRMKRNTRDNVYNICLFNEYAQQLVSTLYTQETVMYLDRKYKKAKEVLAWKRPEGLKRIPNQRLWTDEEDAIVLNTTDEKASELLGRTIKSIKIRRWRLCPSASKTAFKQTHYTKEDDEIILSHSLEKAAELLNRSRRVVQIRKRKLLN